MSTNQTTLILVMLILKKYFIRRCFLLWSVIEFHPFLIMSKTGINSGFIAFQSLFKYLLCDKSGEESV